MPGTTARPPARCSALAWSSDNRSTIFSRARSRQPPARRPASCRIPTVSGLLAHSHEFPGSGQQCSRRGAQALGKTDRHRIGVTGEVGHRTPSGYGGVEIRAPSRCTDRPCSRARSSDLPHVLHRSYSTAAPVVGIFPDRFSSVSGKCRFGERKALAIAPAVNTPSAVVYQPGQHPGYPGQPADLVIVDVGLGADDNLLPRPGWPQKPARVAHGAAEQKKGGPSLPTFCAPTPPAG